MSASESAGTERRRGGGDAAEGAYIDASNAGANSMRKATLTILAALILSNGVSAAAPAPLQARVDAIARWVQTLPEFKKAKLTDPIADVPAATRRALGVYAVRLVEGDLAIDVVSTGQHLSVTLYSRALWTDHAAAVLQRLAQRLLGEAGDTLTPSMAMQAHQKDEPLEERLSGGKIELNFDDAGAGICPWSGPGGGCYAAEITAF